MLRSSFLPELSKTIELPGRDYPYRGYCTKEQMGGAMVQICMALNYGNFKSEVTKVQGLAREQLYARVWGVMNDAEKKIRDNEDDNKRWAAKEQAGWFGKDGEDRAGWYKHQTAFQYSKPANKSNRPVTKLDDHRGMLNAADFEDPFDHDRDDEDLSTGEVSPEEIGKMTDEEFEAWLDGQRGHVTFRTADGECAFEVAEPATTTTTQAFDPAPYVPMPTTERNDLDFLDDCAKEIAEMQAAQSRSEKNGGVSVRRKHKPNKRRH